MDPGVLDLPGSARLVESLNRMKAPERCVRFYREHVEADAVHEQVVRTDVVADFVTREPHLETDVVFGTRAFDVVDNRLATHLMSRRTAGEPSLRAALS